MDDILAILRTIREIQGEAESPEARARLIKLEREIESELCEYHSTYKWARC